MSGHESGCALLDDIAAFLRRFVVIDDHQTTAVVLWIVHTHAIDAADIAPYLAITSAEKRSGKSTLLHLVKRLVHKPRSTANISPAALFRWIEQERPTLLFDEIDAIFTRAAGEREQELRGLLNAGFEREGDGVVRCTGPSHTPTLFDVFGPKALSGIGALPDTIADRAIGIRMRRKKPTMVTEKARARNIDAPAAELRERAAVWASERVEALIGWELEDLPIDDRANDIWEPLVAIAQAAGGNWPDRARQAALVLSGGRDADDQSAGIRLLADVQTVFSDAGTDRLPSVDLCDALNGLEDAPWGGWNNGSGVKPRDIAKRLREYDVVPATIKMPDGRTPKGYRLDRLKDAFERYLTPPQPPSGASETQLRHLPHGDRDLAVADRGDATPIRNPEMPHGDREVAELRIDDATSAETAPQESVPADLENWRDMLPGGER